jgi:hypothetical protein
VTVASHILFAQQGIRVSRPAADLKRNGGSGLSVTQMDAIVQTEHLVRRTLARAPTPAGGLSGPLMDERRWPVNAPR